MAGAPLGNINGKRAGEFRDAVRKAVMEIDEGETQPRLRKIALQLCRMAEDGKIEAIREIGDRLDGKPKQAIDFNDENGNATASLAVLFMQAVVDRAQQQLEQGQERDVTPADNGAVHSTALAHEPVKRDAE